MLQAGIDPPAQSHDSYEARPLPPSHHGWILELIITQHVQFAGGKKFVAQILPLLICII